MADSTPIFAFLAMLISIGAIAISSRAVVGAARQYEDFVKTHITALRNDLANKSRELTKVVHDLGGRVEGNTQTDLKMADKFAEILRDLDDLRNRVAAIEEASKSGRAQARRAEKTTVNPHTGLREKVG